MVKSRYIGDGHPTFNRNPYNGYINPYYWVDDHPLLYGNNGSLDIYIWEETSVELLGILTTQTLNLKAIWEGILYQTIFLGVRLAEIAIDALVYGRVRGPQMQHDFNYFEVLTRRNLMAARSIF